MLIINFNYICIMKKLSQDLFIEKSNIKHNNYFDYKKSIFKGTQQKLIITCPIHGDFTQVAGAHLRGVGCSKCSGKYKMGNSEFKTTCGDIHDGYYDYSLVNFIGGRHKIKIICSIHGLFEQEARIHLDGHGCPKCNSIKKDKDYFVNKANGVHDNFYDYSNTFFISMDNKLKIICPTHGVFEQRAADHLDGHGCEECGKLIPRGPSKSEIEILEYLKSISITAETSNRTVLNGLELDIHIPSHNIAIEFDGLYWHSEVHKDKKYHLRKTELCLKKGIQLIHIFEDEWILKKDIVKSRLKNILGLTSNKIFGRKTVIKEVETKQARLFFENNHLQGYTNSKIKLGLYYKDELVSCMLFSKPRIGIGSSYDGYELTRFANLVNTNVIGGASKLLKHFEKVYQPVEIRSYADRRWSDGGLYDVLGFELSHINKPNYWYIEGNQRKHRFGYRKVNLKKLGFDIKDKTEHEIMLERKIYRIYDCGTLSYKKYSSKYH